MRRLNVLLTVCLLVSGTSRLMAQSSLGAIVGVITDPTGAVTPGAKVVVTNLETNVSFQYETDHVGSYYVPSVIPGHYRVNANKAGFRQVTVTPVVVDVNQTVRVDISMPLGGVGEAVEVSAIAQLVNTDTSTLGQVVGDRQMIDLPLSGRDFTNLIALDVGVTRLQGGIAASFRLHGLDSNFASVSVNGTRPSSISYLIDGVTTNDPLFQVVTMVPPPDAIQEFKLQNALYSADFGMGAAQVNIALKSGTNTLHGSAWEFLRNDALQPMNPRFHTSTPLKQNQFGAAGGGPVYLPRIYNGRNRTFFFGSYEGGRRRTGSVSQGQVATQQEKQGNFSDWPVQLYDPMTGVPNPGGNPVVIRDPFPNNQIPVARFASVSKKLLAYSPDSNVTCAALPCGNYQAEIVKPINTATFTVRGDQYFSNSDRIFGQFLYQNQYSDSPSLIPLGGSLTTQNSRQVGLKWTHIFSPRTINEARAGFNRINFGLNFDTAYGPTNYWQSVGLQNLAPGGAYNALPYVNIGSQYTPIGSNNSCPFLNISNIFQYSDTFAATRGRHSLKLGADIRRNQNFNENGFQGNGELDFTGAYTAKNPLVAQATGQPNTGNAFADFLLGDLSTQAHTAKDTGFSRLRNTDYMFFFQDDFRVSTRLTLNLGVRWELHTPFMDVSQGGRVLDTSYPGGRILYRDQAFTKLANNPVGYACCAPASLFDTDYKDWAPRVGFAWRPVATNRFVVRGGYAITYDVLDNDYTTSSIGYNFPIADSILRVPTLLETVSPIHIDNLFPPPYPIAATTILPPYCQAAPIYTSNSSGVVTQVQNNCFGGAPLNRRRTPYTQQWALNLQYQLLPDLLLELGYQGSHSLRVPERWTYNQAFLPPVAGNPNNSLTYVSQCPPGTYPNNCDPIQQRVPFSNLIATAGDSPNIGTAMYHGMTFKVDKRFSHGLQMLGSFTWSKVMDQVSELQTYGGISTVVFQYAHSLNLEQAPAGFDQTRRLVMSWVYELPVGKGKPLLNRTGLINRLLGGWQMNGIQTFADGTPFTVLCGACGDRTQTGASSTASVRPNVSGNPLPSGFQRTRTAWFLTSVYSTPQLGTLGNSGRNTLRSTGQRATDFSLVKDETIHENLKLQFRGEFFNLFSSHFYTPVFPTATMTSSNFGSLYPVGGDAGNLFNPRIIQVALRVTF